MQYFAKSKAIAYFYAKTDTLILITRIKIIFFIVFATLPYAQAQTNVKDDIDDLHGLSFQHKHIKYKGFLFLYKEFISSQDHSNCSFTPSCSVYMSQSISQYGLFRGILRGADRLARCNGGISAENYTFDPETKRLYDPVE